MNFLGCLFILLFGTILFVLGFARMIWQLLFGTSSRSGGNTRQQSSGSFHHTSSSGNARHEGARPNSRQRRSKKIFEKDEGQYVEFEDIVTK